MTRPLRIEFPGALYHITTRGNRKAAIYRDDTDRLVWQQTLSEVCRQFNFVVYAFCQMGNHFHLLLEAVDGNLSQGMRQLNGVYSQYFNRRHDLVGHVFQGRYSAILVQRETYLLEVARYIVLNPVRAKLVTTAQDWPWSSYRQTLTLATAPTWLCVDRLLAHFDTTFTSAADSYRKFVDAGIDCPNPASQIHKQLLLGDGEFIEQFKTPDTLAEMIGISRTQRSLLAPSLSAFQEKYTDRNEAMARAYASNAYTLTAIARHFAVSVSTVRRAIALVK
ncbi:MULTISPECIES: transposase [unclassified Duganella]|uniref:transposase n=1 Tax=unclassified Duganella TaxID=2636909 RepID=UPI000E345592|nr:MULTISPECIES: transposase [unclassified Duganella]RFP13605.1 transposase [Duganella sp. BJB475]RFP36313.1 transposase [Duganella sp. BJB476]